VSGDHSSEHELRGSEHLQGRGQKFKVMVSRDVSPCRRASSSRSCLKLEIKTLRSSRTAGLATRYSVPEDLNLQHPCCEDVRAHCGRFVVRHTREKLYADVAYGMVCLVDGSNIHLVPRPLPVTPVNSPYRRTSALCGRYLRLHCWGANDLVEKCTCVFLPFSLST
jgi:hypothetical protein